MKVIVGCNYDTPVDEGWYWRLGFILLLLTVGVGSCTLKRLNERSQKAAQEKLERERTPKDSVPKFWR